jgi:hypothetical protein
MILNDTSQRGELTGHAHRHLALLYLRYSQIFLQQPPQLTRTLPSQQIPPHTCHMSLWQISHAHLLKAQEIFTVLTDPELDLYFFEHCGAMNSFWENWTTTSLTLPLPLSTGDDTPERINPSQLQTFFLSFKETIESCLSFPCSSGIDREIYLLYGSYLTNFCDALLQLFLPSRNDLLLLTLTDSVVPTMKIVIGMLRFLGNETSSEPLQILGPSQSLSEEDIECLSLAGNVSRALLEVLDWITSIVSTTPQMELLSDHAVDLIWLRSFLRLVLMIQRSPPEILFSALCSLGEDFLFLGSLLARHHSHLELSKFSLGFEEKILVLLRTEESLRGGESNGTNEFCTALFELCHLTSLDELIWRLIQHSRTALLTSLTLYDSLLGTTEVIDSSDHCTLLYNLLCVSWRLHQLENSDDNERVRSARDCEKYLQQYLEALSREKREKINNTELIKEVMTEIEKDQDIIGFIESDVCRRVREDFINRGDL